MSTPKTIKQIFKEGGEKFPFCVAHSRWEPRNFFKVIARTSAGTWIGETESGISFFSENLSSSWLPYEPPKPYEPSKPKVMRAQYAHLHAGKYYITSRLFRDDEEFKTFFENIKWFKRLAEMECES